MKQYTVYETATGRVLQHGSCPDIDFTRQARTGQAVLEGIYGDEEYYVSAGSPTLRPESPITSATLTVSEGVAWELNNIPAGTSARVKGPAFLEGVLNPGTDTITFDVAGTYSVQLSTFPYLDKTLEVTVNAA